MLLKMPRVVSDQRNLYDTNELFRRLSRDSEVKYTGFRDRGTEERRLRFQNSCQAGRAEIAFVNSGTNFTLHFFPWTVDNIQGASPPKEYVNFEQEQGKVYLMAPFILNGVCVCWKGWVNLHRLDGMGHLEFDEERARVEAAQQVSNSQQQANKIPSQKPMNHKHPASGSNAGQLDKRPRLH
ncbi:core-binding factor subunit beta-like [Clavelina lepadiformis]|uniref:Core-binding factor subunit beta n=1 Tax=Clavelina lepadiformis TaxID=159417 RepID=A0ABP0GTI4_CLALP